MDRGPRREHGGTLIILLLAEDVQQARTVVSELTLLVNIAGLGGLVSAVWLLARMGSRIERLTERHDEACNEFKGDLGELRATVTELAAISTSHETHRQVFDERLKDVHRRLRLLEDGRRAVEETSR